MKTLRFAVIGVGLALLTLPSRAQQQIGGPAPATITPAPAVFVNGTSSVPVLLPNGSNAAPALAFTAQTNTGLIREGPSTLGFVLNGFQYYSVGTTFSLAADGNLAWSTVAANGAGTKDVFMHRSAAKTLTIDTDAVGGPLTLVNLVTGTLQQNGRMVPTLAATGRQVAQTGAVGTLATLTPTADGSFQITGNITITAFTTAAIRLQLNYTSEDNIARALNVPLWNANAWGITAGAADVFVGGPITIRAKASTSITLSTAGTFTTVTYNAEGFITQIN